MPAGEETPWRSLARPQISTRDRAHSAGGARARALADADELHLKDQCRPTGDRRWGTAPTVTQPRGDDELALAANLHACNTLVPASDDLARAEHELEWLHTAAGAVEDGAVGQRADVVNNNLLARNGFLTVPHMEVLSLELTAPMDDGLQERSQTH